MDRTRLPQRLRQEILQDFLQGNDVYAIAEAHQECWRGDVETLVDTIQAVIRERLRELEQSLHPKVRCCPTCQQLPVYTLGKDTMHNLLRLALDCRPSCAQPLRVVQMLVPKAYDVVLYLEAIEMLVDQWNRTCTAGKAQAPE